MQLIPLHLRNRLHGFSMIACVKAVDMQSDGLYKMCRLIQVPLAVIDAGKVSVNVLPVLPSLNALNLPPSEREQRSASARPMPYPC